MSFINAVKNFIGLETDEYYDDDYYEEEEEIEEEPERRAPYFSKRNTSKVVPIGNSSANAKIRIIKPNTFDDSTKISDEVKARRLVIFDVGNMDEDEARRVVDFVAGSVYGLSGNIRRVSGGIFVAAPSNVDITGDNLQAHTRNSFDWNV